MKSLKKKVWRKCFEVFDCATSERQFTPYGLLQTEIMREVGEKQLGDTLGIIFDLQQTYFSSAGGF